jgi:hypothetical protein
MRDDPDQREGMSFSRMGSLLLYMTLAENGLIQKLEEWRPCDEKRAASHNAGAALLLG